MNTKKTFTFKVLISIILLSSIIGIAFLINSQDKHQWESGKTDFSLYYTSVGTATDGEINISINKDGKYEFVRYENVSSGDNKKIANQFTTTLTDTEMKSLFNYMINEVKFFKPFKLKEDLSVDKVMDASYDHIEITFNGESHKIGGYASSLNKDYQKATKEFHKLNEKFMEELKPN